MKMRTGIFLAAICLIACGATLLMNGGVANAATSKDVVWESGIYEFQPVMDTFTYGLTDEIPLTYKIESESPVLSRGRKT